MPQITLRRTALFIGVVATVLALWVFWFEPASLSVSEEALTIDWPYERTLRIAVLADLHVGSPFNSLHRLRKVVERTNAAGADIVCILGDLVIHRVVGGSFIAPDAIADELSKLRAPYGVVAVIGNHDAWLGGNKVRDALTRKGIRVLEDQSMRVETPAGPIWLAGVSDFWTGKHDVASALRDVVDDRPVIVLTHNPDVFPEIPARVSLTLAGHTHGGQVNFPLAGAPIVPSKFGQRFAAGHIIENGRHLFVATGIGTSILPVRFRIPPTIPVLRIGGERSK